jgi:hypothetical protein
MIGFRLIAEGSREKQIEAAVAATRQPECSKNLLLKIPCIYREVILNRHQKERFVLNLHKEGKTYRQIAQEARISFGRIKAILDKYGADNLVNYRDRDNSDVEDDENNSCPPISSEAYGLFSEGKSPLDVARALHLRGPEVLILYKEYRDLKHAGSFTRLYEEVGDDIQYLLRLSKLAKAQGLSVSQVINYLTTFSNYLPAVELQYQNLQNDAFVLLSETSQREGEFEDLNTRIELSLNILKSLQTKCENAESEINDLLSQKRRIESIILQFKENDYMYKKIEQFVEGKVNVILRNNTKLLELSLISALKSFKNDPNS